MDQLASADSDMLEGQPAMRQREAESVSAPVKVADGDAFVLVSVKSEQQEEVTQEQPVEDAAEQGRWARFLGRIAERVLANAEGIGNALKRLQQNIENPILRAPIDLLVYSTGNATRLGGFAYMGYDISQGIAGRIAPSLDKENPNNLKDFASVFGVASSAAFMLEDSYQGRLVDDIIHDLDDNLSKVGFAGMSSIAEQRRAEMPMQEKVQKLASDKASKLGAALQIISSGFMFGYGAREKKAGERGGAILNIFGFGAKLLEESESLPERAWYDPRRITDYISYRPSIITGFTGNFASLGSISAGIEDFVRGFRDNAAGESLSAEDKARYRAAGAVQGAGQLFNSIGDFAMGSAKKDFVGLNNDEAFFHRVAEVMVKHLDTAQGDTIDEKLTFAAGQIAEQLSFEMSLKPQKIENKLLALVQVDPAQSVAL